MVTKGRHNSPSSLDEENVTPLVTKNQLIPITIQPKSISFEQICYKISQGIVVTSLHCLLLSTSKNKDLKRISKSATNEV